MKVLLCLPHFFAKIPDANFGSRSSKEEDRLVAFLGCVRSLRQTFGAEQAFLDHMVPVPAPHPNGRFAACNQTLGIRLDVVVCTTGDSHLISPPIAREEGFHHVQVEANPWLLGFACRNLLAAQVGHYDLLGYMEDDLSISDPLFFQKILWFNTSFGDEAVLFPNRFEILDHGPLRKMYIDGRVREDFTAKWQNVNDRREIHAGAMGVQWAFHRSPNPHCGCYFLTRPQFQRWKSASDFEAVDTSFAGPLESAANLGIMKNFRIYKPSPENAGFLEVKHLANRYLGKILRLPTVERT